MDYEASKRVRQVLTSLVDGSRQNCLDSGKLGHLKAVLKQDEQLVEYATSLLFDRLAANHSQTRKLCVDLCAVLFSRSRHFRRLLTAQFTSFVDLSVGHRLDQPLPPPASSAQALRARALEVIDQWHEVWGSHYPQVTVAYRYLKKQYKFPEIASRAATAAAEAIARMLRHQDLLMQRYIAMKADFPQQRSQIDILVQQLQECLRLLREQPHCTSPGPPDLAAAGADVTSLVQQQGSNSNAVTDTAGVQDAGCEAGQQWEDVPPAAPLHGTHAYSPHAAAGGGNAAAVAAAEASAAGLQGQVGDADGFHAVDNTAVDDFDMDELVGDFPTATDMVKAAEQAAGAASLQEQLKDLTRQAALAAQNPLLDWLRLLTQVQLMPPQQQGGHQVLQQSSVLQQRHQQWQQERQMLLRDVVQLRAQLQALVQEAASVCGVPALAHLNTMSSAAAAAAVTEPPAPADEAQAPASPNVLAEPDSASAADATCSLHSLPSRMDRTSSQQQHTMLGHQSQQWPSAYLSTCTHSQLVVGAGLQRLQQQQHQQQQGTAGKAAVRDAYEGLRDPTAVVGSYTITREVIARNEQQKLFSSLPTAPLESPPHAAGPAAAAVSAAAAASRPTAQAPQQGHSPLNKQQTRQASSSQPEVLKRLLAAAPQLPISGEDWLLAEYTVNRHGMELYNHWGAVDASVDLPPERRGQLLGYASSYYRPQVPRSQPAAQSQFRPDGVGQGGPQHSRPGSTPGSPHPAAAAARPTPQADSRDEAAQQSPAAAASDTGELDPEHTHTGPPQHDGQRGRGVGKEAHQAQQQQQPLLVGSRQDASAYNRAVLSGAFTDAGVAAALHKELNEAPEEQIKARSRKAPERKADKIRRKLLG